MTDEQIRLYAIARCVVPSGTRIRTIAEPTSGGSMLYTLEMKTVGKSWVERWFAVHHDTLLPGVLPDLLIAEDIRRAIGPDPAARAKKTS